VVAVLLSVCVDVAHGAAVWSSIMTILGGFRVEGIKLKRSQGSNQLWINNGLVGGDWNMTG